jgi:hypothetical protein
MSPRGGSTPRLTDLLTDRQSQRDSDRIHQYPEDEDRDGLWNAGFFAA